MGHSWLKKNKLQAYCESLVEEGFDDLQSLVLLTADGIDELSTAISMKKGHKMKFPVLILQAREQMDETMKKQKREKEEMEEERKREKERKRREEERKEAEMEEERKREKERKRREE